jgi:protein required for attachment to host cells
LARAGGAQIPAQAARSPRGRGEREAKSLILVAPPRALGVLRQALSTPLRSAVRGEIDKDLVKLPVYEIEKHLAG